MATPSNIVLLTFILLNLINVISTDDGIPENRGLSWYESLPAVAMDYKVHIDAGEKKTRLSSVHF